MIGRLQHLEKMGLASSAAPGEWMVGLDAERHLRDLGLRGDIIKTMHRAFAERGEDRAVADYVIEGGSGQAPIIGRLVDRGLHDELTGEAYAVIDGTDGRAHHVRFRGVEAFEHAPAIGGIVEVRRFGRADEPRPTLVLASRSDLELGQQIKAPGATWLDHRLVEADPMPLSMGGFGREVREALQARAEHLADQGLGRRQGQRIILQRDLLATLRRRELDAVGARLSAETGLAHMKPTAGDQVAGSFSIDEAVAWLSNPMTGSSYQVELFDSPPPRSEWDRLDLSHRRLVESFVAGFAALDRGLVVERLPNRRHKQPILSVRLDQSGDQPVLRLNDAPVSERRRELAAFNPDVGRHLRLLAFLDSHPLVRRIELPGIVVRAARPSTAVARARPTDVTIPVRDSRRSHPRLGIIDGGIGEALSDWIIDRWDVLAEEDTDLAHGTFIGGLAALGGALNGGRFAPSPTARSWSTLQSSRTNAKPELLRPIIPMACRNSSTKWRQPFRTLALDMGCACST